MNPEEPSLLTHLNEVRFKNIPEGGLSTIIYCGKVRSEADIPDALLTHRRIVEEEVFTEKCNVSGILISQSNTILHLLEGPSSSVLRILRQLSRHAHFRDVDNRIQNGRIVYCVEDRPQRIYPDWYSSSIHEIKSFTEDVGPEACKDVVHQVATDLFEIGYKLTNESSLPEDVDLSRFSDLLPGKLLMLAFSDAMSFHTLEEFVETFFDPYSVSLESENVWPLEALVKY